MHTKVNITNYLPTGTSLTSFYNSERIPYGWFDSLSKPDEISLPLIDNFYSNLTSMLRGVDAWRYVERFEVRYYNNADGVGFVEAVEKII